MRFLSSLPHRSLAATFALLGIAATSPMAFNNRAVPATIQKAGEPVVIDPNGIYVRASRLGNNSIIVGYAAHDGDQQVLRVSSSVDGAETWQRLGEVWRADLATHDIDNAMPLQLPSGRILYAFRNHDRLASGQYTFYRLTVCSSDDGGRTWQFLSHVEERRANKVEGANNGVWEPFLRLALDSTVQVYYSSENDAHDQDNLMRYSRDGGASWSGPKVASGGDTTTSRDGMTGVTDIDGRGNLICIFESTESGPFTITRVLSHDDGHTWGKRARVYTAAGGRSAGAPQVHNVGGTLVASFMTNEGVASAPEVDGGEMKVVTSVNGARAWTSGRANTEACERATSLPIRERTGPGCFRSMLGIFSPSTR